MPLTRLLIANRGEIARRIIRTARGMGIAAVAVYSDADADALHVGEADRAVALVGNASVDSYLRIDKLLAAAKATGADAVHPGYGFLSENADFAQAVIDAGLTWVGPPPQAIRALGSKSAAKRIAAQEEVPCLPGWQGEDQSDARLQQEAQRIGLPLMVKAAAGGGGRGMRLVTDLGDLPAALASARGEALSAFGNGELLLERALLAPRHVEVQVFADTHGHCIHLGERDCSVQRRHQKLIEETPSPVVTPELRARMGECAVRLARAAGYVGAGTVEFLVDGGEFFLMEMNTRLQVEHPVTECVAGLDLVEWQLRIARGEPLPLRQDELRFDGHAIEVRLCAEDDDFTPHAGTVARLSLPAPCEGLRVDHALFEGLRVPPYYDSMLGKLIAHAPTREEAIDRLAAALDRLCVLGLPTNRALLAACLRHPDFRAGRALVPLLAQQGDAIRAALRDAERQALPAAARAVVMGGGAPLNTAGAPDAARRDASPLACAFVRPARVRHRDALIDMPMKDADAPPDALSEAGRASDPVRAARVPGHEWRWHVQVGAVDLFVDDASFDPPADAAGAGGANELRAPFNGKLIALRVQPGDRVRRGDVLAVVESMKLEHSLAAASDGTVAALPAEVGRQVAPGQVLVRLEA